MSTRSSDVPRTFPARWRYACQHRCGNAREHQYPGQPGYIRHAGGCSRPARRQVGTPGPVFRRPPARAECSRQHPPESATGIAHPHKGRQVQPERRSRQSEQAGSAFQVCVRVIVKRIYSGRACVHTRVETNNRPKHSSPSSSPSIILLIRQVVVSTLSDLAVGLCLGCYAHLMVLYINTYIRD